jgi:hypothetical protein
MTDTEKVSPKMEERYGKEVTGVCKICEAEGKTEMHHIISQSKIEKMERPDLLTNPGNLIELCIPCHDLTDSSIFRRWWKSNPKGVRRSREEVRKGREKKRLKKGLFQCKGHIKSGRQCEKGLEEEGYCRTHLWQTYKELVEAGEIPNDYP